MKNLDTNIPQLDPSSNRYRICPYCKIGHMVNHLGRDYCCDQHADKHYNETRRLKKQMQKTIKEPLNHSVENEVIEIKLDGSLIDSKQEGIDINVRLLDKLTICPKEGSIFKIPNLEANGFNFKNYSLLIPNENVPKDQYSCYILVRNYKIIRIEKEKVKIIKTIN